MVYTYTLTSGNILVVAPEISIGQAFIIGLCLAVAVLLILDSLRGA
jgi:uncharacterized protein (DUF433 family)